MRKELEELKNQYHTRRNAEQCVRCGTPLEEDKDDRVETLTGWPRCVDCRQDYRADNHFFAIQSRMTKKAKDLGIDENDLPEDVKEELLWELEGSC